MMSIKKLSLDHSKQIMEKARIDFCQYCDTPLTGVQISHYPHPEGWDVKGHGNKLWLFIVCPQCNYQWALWKLGVFREGKLI